MGSQAEKPNVMRAVIEEFPQGDGNWIIRWVDGYHLVPGAASQVKVNVYLERLDLELRQAANPAGAARSMTRERPPLSDLEKAPVAIGNVPDLAIGGVYRCGSRIATIGLKEDTFRFDLARAPARLVQFYDTCLDPPSWWDSTFTHRVVNQKEYRIPNRESWCVMLGTPKDGRILLIPCHEVFRYFYAKESNMATALLSGPWEFTKSRVVNPERTFVRADDDWQIVLRNGMREDSALHSANLVLHPEGFNAAKKIFSSFAEGPSPWSVKAEIPFATQILSLRGKFLRLRNDGYEKLLCTQITGALWPHPNTVHYRLENDASVGKHVRDSGGRTAFWLSRKEISALDDQHMRNTSAEDPTYRGPAVEHSAPGGGWFGSPQKRKMTKEESYRYRRPKDDPDLEPADSTSTRIPTHGDSNATVGSFNLTREAMKHLEERFAKVLKLFDHLKELGDIDDWRILPPSAEVPRFVVEGEPVWPLPTKARNVKGKMTFRPWTIVDKSTGRPRCALISQLMMPRGHYLYWLDVEPTIPGNQEDNEMEAGNEVRPRGFRSLILATGRATPEVEEILKSALGLCVHYRGIWPEPAEIVRVTGADAATCWTHYHKEPGVLSVKSASKAIKQIAARY